MPNVIYAGRNRHRQQDKAAELYIFHDKSHGEIAEMMAVPETTVSDWSRMQNWVERRQRRIQFGSLWPEQLQMAAEDAFEWVQSRKDDEDVTVSERIKMYDLLWKADQRLQGYHRETLIDEAGVALDMLQRLVYYLRGKDPAVLGQLEDHLKNFAQELKNGR